jgi:hypothetical protein
LCNIFMNCGAVRDEHELALTGHIVLGVPSLLRLTYTAV